MKNWRLRTKVVAVIVVPTLTALVLGSLRAAVDLERAAELRHTRDQVNAAMSVTKVVHELQKERTLAAAWSAAGKDGARTELDSQIETVDEAVREAQQAANSLDTDDEAVKQRYTIGLQRLSVLDEIRNTAQRSRYPDVAVYAAYSGVLDTVIRLGREVNLALTDRELLNKGLVIQALSQVKENVAKENAIMQIAAERDRFPADTLNQIRDAQADGASALATYRANASTAELQLYSDTVTGPEVDRRQRLKAQAIAKAEATTGVDTARDDEPSTEVDDVTGETDTTDEKKTSLDIDRDDLTTSGAETQERLRQVETDLLQTMRDSASALAASTTTSALQGAAILFGALIVAFGLMTLVIRSLLRPIRTLRREALEVANRRLPATVKGILANPDPAEAAKGAVEPVAVTTREETGQVARAFDAVQEQAVLMATEQALMRDNMNSILVNLSRRSQALVERQLSLIDGLELDEQDPDQLSSLFELDHLATRMRRYSESLLVLSGKGLSRQFQRPVPTADVLGAAVSEIEQYARIEVAEAPNVAVQGRAVSDLVHLVAELLDNATFFSEPDRKVTVRAAVTRDRGLGIQVTDRGVGMSEEEIEAANERLADPPDLDVSVTKRMGLYVVARLAKRHGISVRLRENEDIDGGLVARVKVPDDLVQRLDGPSASNGTRAVQGARLAEAQAALPAGTSPASLGAGGANMPHHHPGTQNGSGAGSGGAALFLPESTGSKPVVDEDAQRLGRHHVGDSIDPEADRPTDRLPIYEAMLSQWFSDEHSEQQHGRAHLADPQQADPAQAGAASSGSSAEVGRAGDGVAADGQQTPAQPEWTSPGDEGWRAVAALAENTASNATTTAAGLPKRVPKASLVPGSAQPDPAQPGAAKPPSGQRPAGNQPSVESPPAPARSADNVRGRMSRLQDGVRRGRHAAVAAHQEVGADQEESHGDEEQE